MNCIEGQRLQLLYRGLGGGSLALLALSALLALLAPLALLAGSSSSSSPLGSALGIILVEGVL